MKSDLQLKSDVKSMLESDPSINTSHVGFTVNDGLVMVTGYLGTAAEKDTIERAVQRVEGVTALAVELDVQVDPGLAAPGVVPTSPSNRPQTGDFKVGNGHAKVMQKPGPGTGGNTVFPSFAMPAVGAAASAAATTTGADNATPAGEPSPSPKRPHMNVLAIDVGHGHTKVMHKLGTGAPSKAVFPSFALPTIGGASASTIMSAGLRVITVEAGGKLFRVGKDIEMALPASAERNRDENYSQTDAYLALVRGALHYTRCETIDVLVVGLPLTTLSTNSDLLRQRLETVHKVPAFNATDAAAGKTVAVNVKRVIVMAQPMGALLAACDQDTSLTTARVLTLDYGFYTLGVLASHGIRVFPERLGAIPGGVASYIDSLQKSVGERIRRDRPDLSGEFRVPSSIYEAALRQEGAQVVTLGPGRFDLAQHMAGAIGRLGMDLQRAIAMVGSANDITALVLAGGGAWLLGAAAPAYFPQVSTVLTLDDPQFAIARGFLLYGERIAAAALARAG